MSPSPKILHYTLTFGSRVAVIGLTAVFGVLSARLLGPTDKGTYTVAALLPSAISTIAMLAGPQLVLSDLSSNGTIGPRLKKLLRWSLLVALLGALVCVFFQKLKAPSPVPVATLLATSLALVAPALITPEYLASNLQARGRFGQLAVFRVIQVSVPGLFMLCGVVWAELVGALVGFIVGTVIVGASCYGLWRKACRSDVDGPNNQADIPWKYVLATNFTLVVLFLSYRVDVLVLNSISSAQQVGVYSAAVALAELVLVGAMAAAVVRAPAYARDRLKPIYRDVWLIFWLSAVTAIVIAVVSPTLVPLLFGSEYEQSTSAVWTLLPGVCILAVYRFISNAEIIRGHKFGVLVSCLISIMVDVILLIALAPSMGATGAGIAASSSYGAGLAYLVGHRRFRKEPRFEPGVPLKTRHAASLGGINKN